MIQLLLSSFLAQFCQNMIRRVNRTVGGPKRRGRRGKDAVVSCMAIAVDILVHNHDHIVGEIDMVSQKIGLVQQDLMVQAYLLDFRRNG